MALLNVFKTTLAYNPQVPDGLDRLVKGGTFLAYARDDTSRSTPLIVREPVTGARIDPLRSNSDGVLPDFTVDGNLPEVVIVSGSFSTVLQSAVAPLSEAGWDPGVVVGASDATMAAVADDDASVFAGVIEGRIRVTSGAIANPRRWGAKGDGIADDGPALNAALAAVAEAGGGDLYIPAGTYRTSVPIVQPPRVNVRLDDGARVVATATMPELWRVSSPAWGAAGDGWAYQNFFRGGILDCAGKATHGLHLTGFKGFTAERFTVTNFLGDAILAGTNTSHLSYELRLSNFQVDRDRTVKNPVGSRGLVVHSTDSYAREGVICGAETGVFNNAQANRYDELHVWSWEQPSGGVGTNLHKWSFVDAKDGAIWTHCDSDTPAVAGFVLLGSFTSLSESRVFLNPYAIDGATHGVSVMYPDAGPNFDRVHFSSSSGKQLASDLTGPGIEYPSWLTLPPAPPFDWTVTAPYFMRLSATAIGVTYRGVQPVARRLGVNLMTRRAQAQRVQIIPEGGAYGPFVERENHVQWGVEALAGETTVHEIISGGGQSRYYRGDRETETVRIDAATGGIRAGTTAGLGSTFHSGSGAPSPALGVTGDFYFRRDTPGTPGQRIYTKDGGSWVGIA